MNFYSVDAKYRFHPHVVQQSVPRFAGFFQFFGSAMRRGRDWRAGVCLGLAIDLKTIAAGFTRRIPAALTLFAADFAAEPNNVLGAFGGKPKGPARLYRAGNDMLAGAANPGFAIFKMAAGHAPIIAPLAIASLVGLSFTAGFLPVDLVVWTVKRAKSRINQAQDFGVLI